jgi:hypothetical protein
LYVWGAYVWGGLMRRGLMRAALLSATVVTMLLAPFASGTAAAATASFSNTPLRSWRADGVGYAALVVGDTVYVGGSFSTVTSPDGATVVNRANLAAFDVRTGALITGFQANTNGPVRALAYDGVRLYVGGSYTTINGVSRNRLAAVDPVTGTVNPTWVANANSNVYDLAVAVGKLYVAGSFSTLKGSSRSRLAAVDLATSALDPFAPQVDNTVVALAVSADGNRMYIGGGSYTTVNGTPTKWLTKLDGVGNVIPISWASLDGQALDLRLTADGSRLAAAIGGAGNQGAWYDTATGTRYWRQRCDGDAQAVHVISESMFTGFHEACEGDTAIRLTSNATTNGARDTAFRPSFDLFWGVRGIGGDSSVLVVAGEFTNVSGVPVQGFAIFPAN